MKLESKFAIGDLVEYSLNKMQEFNSFGFITEIKFHKCGVAECAATYVIIKTNTNEVESYVAEHDIIAVHRRL